jgi:hypothetical protein
VVLLAGSWGLKYQVLVTFTKGTEAEHVFFIGTAPAAVPDHPESSIDAWRRVEFSFVYSTAYLGHSGPEQGRCKEIAQDALTGILDRNFQIKVR